MLARTMSDPILHLRHVNVARGSSTVLHDINLTLLAGEHLAILGPNGCGKSTLLKTLTCELYPLVEPGTELSLFGRPRWDLTQLRKRLGVVSPELPGRPTLTTTGFDAILTGFFASSTLWPNLTVTPAMRDRAEVVLRQVDATRLRDKLVGEMSAGQQRRIMIARALVGSRDAAGEGNSTDVLLLDEPTNALDLAAQRDLQQLLRKLAAQGTSLLLITHHISDIIPEMDRILMMRDGRIVADGSKRELLTAERLSGLFGVPIHLTELDGFFNAH